jgi:hypothetical protein
VAVHALVLFGQREDPLIIASQFAGFDKTKAVLICSLSIARASWL